jgi:RNA polymerase sigma-32 factor
VTEGREQVRLRVAGPDRRLTPLDEREREILYQRRLIDDPKTLEELSQLYGVSRERVRQIEVRAFEKLQAAMRRIATERQLLAAA